jgi:hypothetical protein
MTGPPDPFMPEWTAFCDRLRHTLVDVGASVIANSPIPLDRDEGLRMVLRQLQHSLERDFEEHDVTHPVFGAVFTDTYHTLADAPDYAAYDALVSGRHTYRLVGRLGGADSINFTTLAPRTAPLDQPNPGPAWSPWSDGNDDEKSQTGRVTTGTLDLEDLDRDEHGRFELVVSAQRPDAGVWLPMSEATDRIVVRNVYHGAYQQHQRRHPAQLWLECVDVADRPSPYLTDDLRAGLAAVLRGVERIPSARAGLFDRIRGAGNARLSNDDSFWRASGSNPRTRFQEGYWAIAEDEALVLELDAVPACSSWSLGLTNAWMESLDFRYFPINLNSTSAQLDADGMLRIVLAHRDPGRPNWLDVAGHDHGAMLWRWNDVEDPPALPRVELVPLASLRTDVVSP